MTATYHSLKRTKERANLKEDSARKMMEIAYNNGKRADDLPAKERNYMKEKGGSGIEPIYYGGFIFIFNVITTVCITVFHAPNWFLKKTNFDGKKEIRNPKKYYVRYKSYDEIAQGICV